VTALAALLLAAAIAQQASPPVFGVDTDLVRVEVAVTRGGTPILGLREADFELRDNGVLQRLEPVLSEQLPVDMAIVLDTSGSVAGAKLTRLREAATAFLEGLRPDERTALVTFNEEIRLAQPWTHDRTQVRAALQWIVGRGSTALCDAVYAGLRLAEPGGRRTAVVVFSDGLDNHSWLLDKEVIEAAHRSDAMVYGIVAHRPQEPENTFLKRVARASGGRVFAAEETDLRARFLDVLQDIRDRYLLSYSPRGESAGGWHTLEVRLKRVRGDVLARPGYWRSPR
jgi:VWFA-related protein